MRQPDLDAQRIGLLLFRLSFPAMVGMVLYSMFSLVDTYFVARLGSAALAALTLGIPLQVLISSLAYATGVGLTSLISRTLGQGDVRQGDNVAWHGLIAGIIYGVGFSLLGWVYLDQMLVYFGCTADTYELCREYLQIILFGCIFTFILIILENIVQGEGNTVLPMAIGLVGIILNVLFDPLLIFGLGPIPALGMRGAAWATVLAEMISAVVLIGIVVKQRRLLSWDWQNFRPSLRVLKGIYGVGFPSLLMELAWVFTITILNRTVAVYGFEAVAALGIFSRVRSFCLTPVFGLAQAALPVAAFAHGAGKVERVKETLVKSAVIGFVLLLLIVVLMQSYPEWIISWFSQDEALKEAGVIGIRLATLGFPALGIVFIVSTVLQALGKGVKAMMFALLRHLGLFLPLLLVLPGLFGLNGVWLAFSLSELASALLALAFAVNLWQELPGRRPVAMLMLLRPGYWWRRTLAWIK
jgi:putative MATE family efflux protein